MQWKDQSMLKRPALLLCNKDATCNLLPFRLAKRPLQMWCHINTVEKLYQKSSISKIIPYFPRNNKILKDKDTISQYFMCLILHPEHIAASVMLHCRYIPFLLKYHLIFNGINSVITQILCTTVISYMKVRFTSLWRTFKLTCIVVC